MRTLVLVGITSLLAACGSSGDTASETQAALDGVQDGQSVAAQVAADANDEETTISLGDFEASMGEKVPEGFPLPVYEGTIVTMGQRVDLGASEMFTLYFEIPAADPVEVADFYDKALRDKGLEVERQASENIGFAGQKIVNLKVQDGTFLVTSMIASDEEGGIGGTLSWRGPPGS